MESANAEKKLLLNKQKEKSTGEMNFLITETLQYMDASIMRITNRATDEIKEINDYFITVNIKNELKRLQLIDEINTSKDENIAALKKSQHFVVSKSEEISSTIDKCKEIQREGSIESLIENIKRLEAMSNEAKEYIGNLHLNESATTFDDSWKPTKIDESELYLSVQNAIARQSSVFTYTIINDYISLKSKDISVQITDQRKQQIANKITKKAENQYEVHYTPASTGVLNVSITLLPFLEYKFEVKVGNTAAFSIGGKGTENGQFDNPWGLAVDSEGCLYVVDSYNKRIQKFGADGEFLSQFSTKRDDSGSYTLGLALNEARWEIVCTEYVLIDSLAKNNNKVVIYGYDGVYKRSIQDEQIEEIYDVAINKLGEIIISDVSAKCLFMFNKQEKLIKRISHYGIFITVDNENNIIVSDGATDTIKVLDPTGRFLYEFGTRGCGRGQLSGPHGVAANDKHIVVADYNNHRIQIFTKDGEFVQMIVGATDLHICHIAVSGSRIFVGNDEDYINVLSYNGEM